MKRRLSRPLLQVFAFGLAIGLLLAVIHHAVSEAKMIQALFFN